MVRCAATFQGAEPPTSGFRIRRGALGAPRHLAVKVPLKENSQDAGFAPSIISTSSDTAPHGCGRRDLRAFRRWVVWGLVTACHSH